MSLISLLPRFVGMLIIFNLLMIAIAFVFAFFANISMPSGMAAIIPIFAAAKDAGQVYYRRGGELPTNRFSWSVAVLFTALNAVLSGALTALVVGLIVKLNGESFALPPLPDGQDMLVVGIIGGILLFILLVQFLGTRFAFSSGAKQESTKFQTV